MRKWVLWALALAAFMTPLLGGAALASLGQPSPWQLGLQESVSPLMDDIVWFHNYVMIIITLITLFVLALLIYVMVKFNAKANPVPSRTTHHTGLEVAWTLVPVLILVAIAVPSFRILFDQLTIPEADLTIKATGKQWFWTYTYPDHGDFEFDSLMVQDADLQPGQPRLLAADNAMVIPVNRTVRLQTTASDVIHAFALPSFGIKIDSIPGRLNEAWFRATREGVYYGQCSELCGRNHAFMPIEVRVVSDEEFAAWVEKSKEQFAGNAPPAHTAVAAARE